MDKTNRDKYRELGLCSTCGKPAAEGKAMCEDHLAKRRKYAAERRKRQVCPSCGMHNKEVGGFCKKCWEHIRTRRKELTQEKKSRGECTTCGKKTGGSNFQCEECRAKQARLVNAKKEARRKLGLCENCGKTEAGRSHLCSLCYSKEISCRQFGSVKMAQDLIELLRKQGGTCPYTKMNLTIGDNASLDHRIPKSKGGNDDLSNLQWVYLSDDLDVNRIKLDMTEEQFKNAIRFLAESIFDICVSQQ